MNEPYPIVVTKVILRMKVDNFRLMELLVRKKWLGSLGMINKDKVELSGAEKELDIQEFYCPTC